MLQTKRNLRNFKVILLGLCLTFIITPLTASIDDFVNYPGYRSFHYVEEFYGLYQKKMIADNNDRLERIRLLHWAVRAPFAHPVRALARCKNPAEYEKYKYLMYMHICFLLTKEYMQFGQRFDKANLYWYNKQWKSTLLKGFVIAKEAYDNARFYWHKTKIFAKYCIERADIHLEGPEMDRMQDEAYKISMSKVVTPYSENNINYNQRHKYIDFDYDRIIDKRKKEIEKKIEELNKNN